MKSEARAVTIDRMGAAGDGLGGEVVVPFTLPGETVTADVAGKKGRLVSVEVASPVRASPPCRHFGLPGDACGGCKLQHLQPEDYAAWKADRLTAALARAGLSVPPLRRFASPSRSRRRAKLAFRRTGRGVACGFRVLGSDRVVPLTECHVLRPELFALTRQLPALIDVLPFRGEVDALVTLTETGADVDVIGVNDEALSLPMREAAARMAGELDLARLSLSGVTLSEWRPPTLVLGGVELALPAGAFLQATEEGQAQLTGLVLEATRGAGRVADLFCGVGTFALPFSEQATVLAAEAAAEPVAALRGAARRTERPLTAEVRDLFIRPYQPDELAGIDAVVLDPPRAGASAQVEALRRSAVPRIVYVSCDPGALSRDARMLATCYDLTELSLVDQFVWSPHIEAVAVFDRRVG